LQYGNRKISNNKSNSHDNVHVGVTQKRNNLFKESTQTKRDNETMAAVSRR